ncbi:hypothetical protein [Lacticaseibacillus jixiensis]|uniref:hypothetical protein n=1 Tax=Lacticaseibacillus jixiensis TaxID=3231926 RepID=UPI0036F4197A
MPDTTFAQLVATCADELVSAEYTEDRIAKRLSDWQAKNPDADAALLATYQLNEARGFSEALLSGVLAALNAQGYLHQP